MTRPESSTPDRPFPGARSQVPAFQSLPATPDDSSAGGRKTLPLEAVPISAAHGWSVRLTVRAEQVSVTNNVVAYEHVVVRRHEVADVARMEAKVRREELRTTTEGDIEVADMREESIGRP